MKWRRVKLWIDWISILVFGSFILFAGIGPHFLTGSLLRILPGLGGLGLVWLLFLALWSVIGAVRRRR